MNSAAAIVAALIFVSVSRTAAIKCVSCTAAARPRDCQYVMECGAHEQCSVESILTSSGYTVFNVGCTDSHKCASFGKKRAVLNATALQVIQQKDEFSAIPEEQWDQSGSDVLLCAECCITDLCNMKGCGEEGLPKDSGPICYACGQQRSPDQCNTIEVCGRDQACQLSMTLIGYDPVYHSKCIPINACPGLSDTGAHTLIGRRQRGVVMSRELNRNVACNKCCKTNLCNFGNCSSADGQWSLWTTWSDCSQTCGTSGTRNRQRTCNNPQPAPGGKDCVGLSYESQRCDGLNNPPVIQITRNFSEPADSQVVIECLIPGSTSQQQVPSIIWLAPQTEGKDRPQNVEQASDGSLFINGLTVDNIGPYSCQVTTPCGVYTSAQFWVDILQHKRNIY